MTRARDLAAFVSNADGDIKFDTDTLFIDSSANRVGIGTTTPVSALHIEGDTPAATLRDDSAYSAGTGPYVQFQGLDSGGTNRNFAQIYGLSNGSNSGELAFHTRNSGTSAERMRILAGGGITFNGDTAAANALDDYETGTWTPTLAVGTNITYNSQSGTYTKVGRKVFVQGKLDVSNSDSDGSSLQIDLPFTGNSGSEVALFTLGRYFSFLGTKSTAVRGCRYTGTRLLILEDSNNGITYSEAASSGVLEFAAEYEIL